MITMSKYRIGRVCLHVVAMIRDHQLKWHLSGIWREMSLDVAGRTAFASTPASRSA